MNIVADVTTLIALSLAALAAGFVDSIAGGGGLIALPSLILAGLDPVSALATNKLQGTFGTASATYAFWKRGRLDIPRNALTAATVFVGSTLGVGVVHFVSSQWLSTVMPVLLVVIALYFAVSPHFREDTAHPRLPPKAFTFGLAPVIGFYDGFFGPGTGSFFMASLVALFGTSVIDATARTKLFNFASNVAALILFAIGGKIFWQVGLCMGVSQFIGAQLGSHLAIRNGAKIVRPLLVVVCLAMAAKVLFG
jgi:uncharacterized protein